ncbi:sulfite exporter TauE/SafE family protein [Streptomyces longispororuber]|uniref:sulfite exporter TauE/SafE family protein n=1 Tax=Streptomyces longispororuber TaxID=68230 RepID=UPI0036FD8164
MSALLWVLSAGAVAGVLNALGGGGTFVALPALVAAGAAPVTANASSTVALLPGAAVSAWVYRRDIRPVGPVPTAALTAVSAVGGGLGAGLLLTLPAASFDAAVPWLLAFATLVLAFGRRLARAPNSVTGHASGLSPAAVLVGQFLLALYGGYFGGAVGIMMMALWCSGLGVDPAVSNPLRTVQIVAVNSTAALLFLVASDALDTPWLLAALLSGAVVGGFTGAHLARRLSARLLRGVVLTTAVTMTALSFLRG